MRPFLAALAPILTLAALAAPAAAQTVPQATPLPLGITGAEFRLGATVAPAADPAFGPVRSGRTPDLSLGFAAVNVAITRHHGLQLDAALEDSPGGTFGRVAGHLFMTPEPAHKYGLFATLSDLDGVAANWGSFGIEGILALSPDSSVELSGGIGYGTAGLDWIFAGATLAHQAGPATLRAGLELTEFDETNLHSIAATLTLGAETRLSDHTGAFARITHARLDGAAKPQTRLGAGLTLAFGTLGGTSPMTQLFRISDPVTELVRRGWY